MARLQRVVGLLRALSAAQSQTLSTTAPLQQLVRCSSTTPAPAATHIDIEDEWYMRQRSVITLGHRVPHVSVGAWVAPNAVVIGDVDLLDRVRDLAAAGLQQPQPRQAPAADGGALLGM